MEYKKRQKRIGKDKEAEDKAGKVEKEKQIWEKGNRRMKKVKRREESQEQK